MATLKHWRVSFTLNDHVSEYYLSVTDLIYSGGLYRYSLTLTDVPTETYSIGTTDQFKVPYDSWRQVQYTMTESAFVRFNFNFTGALESLYTAPTMHLNGQFQRDSLLTKTVNNKDYYYYYLPKGEYTVSEYLDNPSTSEEGFMKISSKIIDNAENSVPINNLSYTETYPTSFETYEFNASSVDPSSKEGKTIDLPITTTGSYKVNVSMEAADHTSNLPLTGVPSKVFTYNETSETYTDQTSYATNPSQATSFTAMETAGDRLYIGFTEKWHDMEFNFTQGSTGNYVATVSDETQVFKDDGTILNIGSTIETTSDFNDNGTWVLNLDDTYYDDWARGTGNTVDELSEDYYWLSFVCDTTFPSDVPIMYYISLSNITMTGDLNFALIGESGYEKGDGVWGLSQPSLNSIVLSQSPGYETFSDTFEINVEGLNEGPYKLLIVPEKWSYDGLINVKVAIENSWGYVLKETYGTIGTPDLYKYQINNYTTSGYGHGTGPFYSYESSISYNNSHYMGLLVECNGNPYAWTQMNIMVQNITDYDLTLLQDLPWISSSGPNREMESLGTNLANTTLECGIISEQFYLMFSNINFDHDNFQIDLDVNQYNTTMMKVSVSKEAPAGGGGLINGFLIVPIVATLVITVAVVELKSRHKREEKNF